MVDTGFRELQHLQGCDSILLNPTGRWFLNRFEDITLTCSTSNTPTASHRADLHDHLG